MMISRRGRVCRFLLRCLVAGCAWGLRGTDGAWAASVNVDLNADGTAESPVSLTVVSTFPTKIQNKITNKAIGQAFTFLWPSAGPGGFTSQLAPGSSTGVGAIWTWQTSQQVYSFTGNQCANDICLT